MTDAPNIHIFLRDLKIKHLECIQGVLFLAKSSIKSTQPDFRLSRQHMTAKIAHDSINGIHFRNDSYYHDVPVYGFGRSTACLDLSL